MEEGEDFALPLLHALKEAFNQGDVVRVREGTFEVERDDVAIPEGEKWKGESVVEKEASKVGESLGEKDGELEPREGVGVAGSGEGEGDLNEVGEEVDVFD